MTDSGSQPAAVIGGRIRGLPHGRQPTPTEGEVAANLAAQKYPAVAPGTPSNPEPKLGQLSLPRPRRPSSLRLRLRTPCRRLRPRTPSLAPTSHIASHTLSHRHPTAGHFAPNFFSFFVCSSYTLVVAHNFVLFLCLHLMDSQGPPAPAPSAAANDALVADPPAMGGEFRPQGSNIPPAPFF